MQADPQGTPKLTAYGALEPQTACEALPIEITSFSSVVVPVGRLERFDSFGAFCAAVRATPETNRWPGTLPTSEQKRVLPGFSAAVFDGNRRARANVRRATMLILDFDNASGTVATPRAALDVLPGALAMTYTSPSNSPDHPKFRLAMSVSRPILPTEFDHVWQWASDHFRAHGGFVVDASAKDPSRFWYSFAPRPDFGHEVIEQHGRPLNVDGVLAKMRTRLDALAAAQKAPCERVRDDCGSKPAHTLSPYQRAVRYVQNPANCPIAIQGQHGRLALLKAASNVGRGFALSFEDTLEILRRYYNPACDPPWQAAGADDREFRRIVRDALERGKKPWGKHLEWRPSRSL
jgi:hypothetical protein